MRVRTYCFPGFLRGLPGTSTRNHPHDPTTSKPVVPGGMSFHILAPSRVYGSAWLETLLPVPRWNPPRWWLGPSALVAVVVAGCGAAGTHQKPSLHAQRREAPALAGCSCARGRDTARRRRGTRCARRVRLRGQDAQNRRTADGHDRRESRQRGTHDRRAGRTAAAPCEARQRQASSTSAQPTPRAPPRTPLATTPTHRPRHHRRPPSPTPAPTTPTAASRRRPGRRRGRRHVQHDMRPRWPRLAWPGHGRGYGHNDGSHAAAWWSALRNWFNSRSGARQRR